MASLPSQREPALPCFSRQCAECGEPFKTSQPTAAFCSRKCKTDSANLEAARGKKLYRLAYGWREGSGAAFSDVSWLVDQFRREDREQGRPPPPFGRRDGLGIAFAHHTAVDSRKQKKARERATNQEQGD